jgi:hypothetical protein
LAAEEEDKVRWKDFHLSGHFRTVGVAANQNFSAPEITRTEFTPVSAE